MEFLNISQNYTTQRPQAKEPETIDIKEYEIDLTKDIPEPQPILSYKGVLMLSPGNISAIAGKAKSRKTYFVCLLIAAYLYESDSDLTGTPIKKMVLLFDTEQGKAHVQKVARRVHRMIGQETNVNHSNFKVYALRELDKDQRLNVIKTALKEHNPGLIIIDGIRDIVLDINDQSEATQTATELLRLSSAHDCHILNVIHTNKNDNNLRGSIGTEILNKSETVFSVTKDGELSIIEPEACRNLPFEPFAFRVAENGLPELLNEIIKTNPKEANIRKVLSKILSGINSHTYKELYEKYTEIAGISEPTAKRHIAIAIDKLWITKKSDRYYFNNS